MTRPPQRPLVAPGTELSDPEAVSDRAALARGLAPGSALLCGNPAELVPLLEADGVAAVRTATGADRVPAQWAAALERADAVWVPGEFARAALERSGVSAERVQVVPPVVDTARFAPGGPASRADGAGGFVFLAFLDWTLAAGWDVLVRAWSEEFAAGEDVSLVIRAWSSLGYTAPVVGEALLRELDRLGHDPGDLADLILELSPGYAAPEPALYRGADCLVVPARAEAWGRKALEAMACGVPVIATDWGAGSDLLASGAALPVPTAAAGVSTLGGREQVHLAGGRWGEPDVAALRRQLRSAFTDRDATAAVAARARAYVLARHAEGPVSVQARAERRRVARPSTGARPDEVSFVLQGPVDRSGRGRIARVCESIRAHFPGAEIVISTWEGTDASGLDCDAVVHSQDPGVVGTNSFNVNTNRQIVSSLAGVRAATRPLVAKVRSDILFVSDVLLAHWGRWEERADELRLFERRVLVPNVFARRPTYLSPYPMHPSDWSYFGTRADLELLFDVPHMLRRESESTNDNDRLIALWHPAGKLPSHTPEQWIWTRAMRKVDPDASLRSVFGLTPETVRLTELSFANNVAVLDTYLQYGIWCPKYPWPNRLFEDVTLFQHEQWLELYDLHCLGNGLAPDTVLGLLTRLAKGLEGLTGVTREDAARLRRAGHPWEAQMLECLLVGPRPPRDSTTGGHGRWQQDNRARDMAAEDLARAAGELLAKAPA